MPNFAGADGSRLRFASATHSIENGVAKIRMKTELSDWNHAVGISKLSASIVAIDIALGEEVERRAGLLEARPEQRAADEQEQDHHHALLLDRIEAGEEEHVGEVGDCDARRARAPVVCASVSGSIGMTPVKHQQVGDDDAGDQRADCKPASLDGVLIGLAIAHPRRAGRHRRVAPETACTV